uniref:SGNH hydrolase-type esterase domain-containing protein n=1 Tax=Eutreptiella gymnastica TaxID=73025 RepID=A0A7S4LLK1_9EUGL
MQYGSMQDAENQVKFYYDQYHGHAVHKIEAVHEQLRSVHKTVVFFAGDSSLDNKYWVDNVTGAINGYEKVLPDMKQDVCYWLNSECVARGQERWCCLNTAVEATTLNDRAWGRLLEQDRFIQDHITSDDYLVVSIGGNDIVLQPLLCTILNLLPLVCCTPQCCLDRCGCACPPNLHMDCGCCGCGVAGCLTGLCGCPPGLGYFVDLFKNRVQNYVARLVQKRKPKAVVVCMIYYPDEKSGDGWADQALGCLGYNRDPSRLQCAIRTLFRLATEKISIPGTRVVGFPIFQHLNGRDPQDYIARVEPSAAGGRKMARALMDVLVGLEAQAQ